MQKRHYRTVWLSDIHLGHLDCKAEYLLDFLDKHKIDNLYLVGDIVDMWAMKRQFLWPDAHNQLFYTLLSMPKTGTEVIYLPGNHDAPAQKYDGMTFVDIKLHREYIHTTAQGKKLLILHGDQFDEEVCFGALHSWIGDHSYRFLLTLNRWHDRIRKLLGLPYWSLAGYLKSKVKGAKTAITRFKTSCCNRARERGLDGVVCGHIHYPEIDRVEGIEYFNDGDWIENCSALTEDNEGNMQLVYWPFISADRAALAPDTKSATAKKAA